MLDQTGQIQVWKFLFYLFIKLLFISVINGKQTRHGIMTDDGVASNV
jgi:hypothetical protein